MNSNLLLTKIIVPSRRPDLLRRPRLLEFLHEYIDRKLLLVSAAAGYGKTSLLADFAGDTELPVCWYALDAADGDPRVFVEYFVAAVRRRFPAFGRRTGAVLENTEARNVDEWAGALVTDLHDDIDAFFVMVLDDLHLVESSEAVSRLLDRLLVYLPENAHLILASRTVPAHLNLARLTARQQVIGLGAGDLRFTPDEVAALVQHNYGLEITPQVAEELAAQSEGWIAGLVLTTPTLWRGLFREWVKGHGPGSQLFQYLADEVLSQQPPELQRFLLETSLLPQLQVEWCNELLGRTDAAAMLAQAERRNLFLTRLDEAAYRYHHLFHEFLQARLRQSQPARVVELQKQAAAVFERHGNLDRAIEFQLAAGEPDAAARLLELVAPEYHDAGRWATLRGWIERLPPAVLQARPALILYRAMLAADAGMPDEAQRRFQEAFAEFERARDLPRLAQTLLEWARCEPDPAVIAERSERALAQFAAHDYTLQAQAHHALALAQAHHGGFAAAVPLLQRATALYELAGERQRQAEAGNALGSLYLWTGPHALADAHLASAVTFARRLGHPARLANALNNSAVSHLQQGHLDRAEALLKEALAQAERSASLRVKAYILATFGDLHRDRARWAEALQAYGDTSELAERIGEAFLITYARAAAAQVYGALGDFATAEQVLETASAAARINPSDYQAGLVQLELGVLRLRQAQADSAARHLAEALPRLERARAQRELGRGQLCLAQLALTRGAPAEAARRLRALLKIARALDEDGFILSVVNDTRAALEWAVERRIGGEFFRRVLEKAKLAPRAPAPPLALAAYEPDEQALEIDALGPARVRRGGAAIAWQTATSKELFFFFATRRQGWRKEQVSEALWSNASRSQANDLFHSSLYRLRRAVGSECVVFRNGLYELNPEFVRRVDVDEFERELDAADAAEGAARAAALERAVEWYRGDFLDEFYSDWCIPRREQLRARLLKALAQLAHTYAAQGERERSIEAYARLLRSDPLDEVIYCRLIELYLATGNRAAALRTYQECVTRLADELGVPPLPETVALYERLLTP